MLGVLKEAADFWKKFFEGGEVFTAFSEHPSWVLWGTIERRDPLPATCLQSRRKPVLIKGTPCVSQQTHTHQWEQRRLEGRTVCSGQNCSRFTQETDSGAHCFREFETSVECLLCAEPRIGCFIPILQMGRLRFRRAMRTCSGFL